MSYTCPTCRTIHVQPVFYCSGSASEAPALSLANLAEQVLAMTVRLETLERELRVAKQQIRDCASHHAKC